MSSQQPEAADKPGDVWVCPLSHPSLQHHPCALAPAIETELCLGSPGGHSRRVYTAFHRALAFQNIARAFRKVGYMGN